MPQADSVGSVDPILLLVIVLLCDAVVGGWIGIRALFSAPTGALATVVDWLEAKLNRAERGATTRAVRGAIIVLVIAAAAALLGVWIHGIAGSMPSGAAIEALFVAVPPKASCVGGTCPIRAATTPTQNVLATASIAARAIACSSCVAMS